VVSNLSDKKNSIKQRILGHPHQNYIIGYSKIQLKKHRVKIKIFKIQKVVNTCNQMIRPFIGTIKIKCNIFAKNHQENSLHTEKNEQILEPLSKLFID